MGRAQAPRQRETALSRHLRGCGRAVVPRAASLRDARPAGFLKARRGSGGLRFPPPGFSPRRPPFGGAPFPSADHRPGGKPILVHSLHSFTGGNRTAAIFVCLGRRPSGPPAEISPPLTEHPRPPAVLRGPVAGPRRRARPPRRASLRGRRRPRGPAPIELGAALQPFRPRQASRSCA